MFLTRFMNPVTKFRGVGIFSQFSQHMRRITTEADGDPLVSRINMLSQKDDDYIYISTINSSGFRLRSGLKIVGPCAFFPKTVLQWNVGSVADINEESLSLFTMLEPKLDILLIGIGSGEEKINPDVVKYLRKCNINAEILQTESACASFNFLNSDSRCVAAAVIPPRFVGQPSQDTAISHGMEMTRIYDEGQFKNE